MEPALSPDYKYGFFLPDNGHVRNPLRVVQVLAQHFTENGGRIERAAVHDFKLGADGPVALLTDAGEVPVEHVVIAAGAASQRLAARLGTRVPVAPERGYHIEIPEPGVELRMPVTDGEVKFVATPMENGLRLAGTSEFRHADAPANWARAKALATLGPKMLPELRVENYSEWMGTRPSTPDSLPIVGPAPRCRRVYFAFGHGHFGLMAAPPTGQIIADLIAGRAPRIDITPFRPERFG
jgi:D-amino-acid dehydrogenase